MDALLDKVINLSPNDRFVFIEEVLKSLDTPNAELDKIWVNEAKKRLQAYRDKKISGIAMEEIF